MDKPVAYHVDIAKALGSVNAGLFVAQAMYWTGKGTDPNGWFYKTQDEWYEEIGMGRREQETARKIAKQKGVLEEERRGVPARLFYRINFERLIEVLQDYYDSKNSPNNPKNLEKSRMADSAKLGCVNPPNQNGGFRQTRMAESSIHTITENTTENTYREYNTHSFNHLVNNNVQIDQIEKTGLSDGMHEQNLKNVISYAKLKLNGLVSDDQIVNLSESWDFWTSYFGIERVLYAIDRLAEQDSVTNIVKWMMGPLKHPDAYPPKVGFRKKQEQHEGEIPACYNVKKKKIMRSLYS